MTLQQLISQYNGKKIDYDGNSGAQCVDIVKKWAAENGKPVIKGNAIVWARAAGYVWVPNGPSNKPNPGDIVVFNIGQFGHVAIATDQTTVSKLVTFDQNFPVGAGCRVVNHGAYRGVLGWLRVVPVANERWATVNKAVANVRRTPTTRENNIHGVLYRNDRFVYVDKVTNSEGTWLKSKFGRYVHTSGISY